MNCRLCQELIPEGMELCEDCSKTERIKELEAELARYREATVDGAVVAGLIELAERSIRDMPSGANELLMYLEAEIVALRYAARKAVEEAGERSTFGALVDAELARARSLHPAPLNSLHEGYAVIKEECEEFWEEVRRKDGKRNQDRLLAELVETAAMCRRTAEDVLGVEQALSRHGAAETKQQGAER